MVSVFRSQWGWQRGRVGAWLYFFQACLSIVWNAPGEHLDMLASDLSYAFYAFRRSPWFTAVAIVTLALGGSCVACPPRSAHKPHDQPARRVA